MIFLGALDRAREKQSEFVVAIVRLRDRQTDLANIRARYERYLAAFEQRLALCRTEEETAPLFAATEPGAWEWEVARDNTTHIRCVRNGWTAAIERVRRAEERIGRRIAKLEERLAHVETWLRDRERRWANLDRDTLKGQVRDILRAGDELSRFLLGHPVELAFDTRPDAPLGHVPIHADQKHPRKVHLNAVFLERQPEHLLDYYRALIVHELGHLLLHLKDRDYRRLRKLLREHVSLAPGFFDVFNILLDQQLERVLRDTRPEWQAWFNRLDFYARKIPQQHLRDLLRASGREDANAALAALAQRRLVKLYADPEEPFATIQSGALFSEGCGFSRLYAFYAVFANKLPLASIQEAWLQQCLALLPRDFKTLNVLEVHALAVEVYKIIAQTDLQFVSVTFERAGASPVTIAIPGTWNADAPPGVELQPLRRRRKGRRTRINAGSGDGSVITEKRRRAIQSPPNAEGEPPPPRVVEETSTRIVPQPTPVRYTPGNQPIGNIVRTLDDLPAWARVQAVGSKKARKATNRAGKPARRPPPNQRQRMPQSRPEKQPRPESPRQAGPRHANAEIEQADRLANSTNPTWSPNSASRGISNALNQLLAEVRAEQADPRPRVVAQERITPEGGRPSDQRNETDVRDFPAAERLVRLTPDRRANALLAREVKPRAALLRPYLTVIDSDKVLQERLTGGRRLLTSGLVKHVAYGETRLFADQRFTETELHRDVLLCVLLDTSASMQTDDRLPRAVRVAALLAACLDECPNVESVFVGYNQNLYLCGDHAQHSLTSLAPAGKTNEAAALDHLRPHLDTPRRRKVVLVLSDGLPTFCSVESVRCLTRSLEMEQGARFLYGAMSAVEHPAYRRRVDLTAPLTAPVVRALGRGLAAVLA